MSQVSGAIMRCSFGAAPAALVVLPDGRPELDGLPVATILDKLPVLNIPPFGTCYSPANPTVTAATTAAHGVMTPMPCLPAIAAPWVPRRPGCTR